VKNLSIPQAIQHAALIGIFVFLWNVNSRLASIETTLNLITSGKIKTVALHE
jgi:hypothetical protein